MLYDVLRFNASARRLVGRWNTNNGNNGNGDVVELSIGEYLRREGYSESFRDNYLIVRGGGGSLFYALSLKAHTHTHAHTANDRSYLEYTPRQMRIRLPRSDIDTVYA